MTVAEQREGERILENGRIVDELKYFDCIRAGSESDYVWQSSTMAFRWIDVIGYCERRGGCDRRGVYVSFSFV